MLSMISLRRASRSSLGIPSILIKQSAGASRQIRFFSAVPPRLQIERPSSSSSRSGTMLSNPVNLPKWLEENSHLLKPPVNNYCVWNEGFTVMIVGGPNARTDYHINQTPEWFYQHKGAMLLKVVTSDGSGTATPTFKDIIIREGDMFLLPPNTPHNPVRFADTVGVVLEQRRPEDSIDRLRWYCQEESCAKDSVVVHEAAFHCTDLGTQIKGAIGEFMASEESRRCPRCGTLADSVPRPGSVRDPNLVE